MIDRRNLFMELMSSIGLNPKIENYINGKLVPGIGQTITLIDPYTTDELTNYKDATAILAQEACKFIDENKDRPFVLYVSTFEPHSPYHGPFMDQYDPEKIPVGPAFLKKPDTASLVNRVRADYFMQFMLDGVDQTTDDYAMNYAAYREDITTEIGWRTLRAHYLANITSVDRMVGKVNQAIKDAGIEDNTIVVFTSEHGDMLGDHGMLEKRSMFEEASRVPLVIKVPLSVIRGRSQR